jgi:hypothetical protein
MTSLEVPYILDVKDSGMFYIEMRGLGYQWITDGEHTMYGYCPNIGNITLIKGGGANKGYFLDTFNDPSGKPLKFMYEHAKKIYRRLVKHLEYSPDALAAGTAHENLMRAQKHFNAAKLKTPKTLTTIAEANKRKTRKTRK